MTDFLWGYNLQWETIIKYASEASALDITFLLICA